MLITAGLMSSHAHGSPLSFPDLNLAPGHTCLIRGASGSGKTTFLHTLAGLLPPAVGSVMLDGVSLYDLSESKRDEFRGQKIGIIFQTLHLIKSLTVEKNLQLASYACGRQHDDAQATALLERLGIGAFRETSSARLSQGEAQRVAITRALIGSPSVILADEPTSSLDDKSCAESISLLKDLCTKANTALIITSHDARLGSDFDHIITLGERA